MSDKRRRNDARAADQSARQREQYEQIVNNMSDLLMLLEPGGEVVFCNRRAELPPGGGYYPQVGDNALDLIVEEDRRIVSEAVSEVAARRAPARQVTFRIDGGGGEVRFMEGALTPVVEGDRVVHVEFLGRDVTERQLAARSLADASDALERRQAQLDSELAVAARIHASLLPGPLVTDRILLDVKHIPLKGVGGDYVYFHHTDPLRPAVAIFDVAGHGIASALVAGRVHSAVYAIMSQGDPPTEMIRRLNRFIHESFSDLGIFVTLFGMHFDLEAGSACYCGSGHPPALIRRGDTREIVSLASDHLPIGVAADAFLGAPARHVEIAPGDTVWLYTDGLFESCTVEGKMLGVKGLAERVAAAELPPIAPGLAAHCLEALTVGLADPEDDMTMVVAAIK